MFEKNQIIQAEITAMSSDGKGIARYNDKVIFVKHSAVGDMLEIKIIKELKSYAVGRIEKIIRPSPHRIEPVCLQHCGGCDFLHISYDAEIIAKEEKIKSAFHSLNYQFLGVEKSPDIDGYRNVCRFPVVEKDGEILFGFYRERSRVVVPVENCPVSDPIISKIAKKACEFAEELRIPVYDFETTTGVLRHICVRSISRNSPALIIVAKRKIPEIRELAEKVSEWALEKLKQEITAVLNINPENTNVIFGKSSINLIGGPEKTTTELTLFEDIRPLKIKVSPLSFFQINKPMAEKIYSYAADLVDVKGKNILDLYSGGGYVALAAAVKGAENLTLVEVSPSSAVDAIFNFKENFPNKNVNIMNNSVENALDELMEEHEEFDVVFLDPARKGCENGDLHKIMTLKPTDIVYISCDPSTLARDIKIFTENGYNLISAKGFDMFPRTKHVETVALMSRVSE